MVFNNTDTDEPRRIYINDTDTETQLMVFTETDTDTGLKTLSNNESKPIEAQKILFVHYRFFS